LATQKTLREATSRLSPGPVIVASTAILAVLIVAVSALGTTLLGVPTSYGNGVDSALGARVTHDFLSDQDAEANALSTGDQSLLGGHLSDSALSDVIQQMNSQPPSSTPPKVSFQPASLTILRASDPADASLTIEVQEEGTKSVVTNNGPDQAPSEQAISFHGDFWLRNPSGGHYTIADQHIQTLANSPLPASALVVVAVLAVGLAWLLFLRQRRLRLALTPLAPLQPGAPAPRINLPRATETSELIDEPAEVVVSTFGGLHVRQGGRDWAQALMSRSVSGFVWLRLLVAAIRDPDAPPSRDELAREANPRVSRDVQLKRLRNVINRGLRDMPAALRDRVAVQPEVVSFKLEGCEVDAIELLQLSSKTAGHRELSPTETTRIQRALAACQGVFLPEFETVEDLATDHHPTCTELIREIREMLINRRADLSLLLGDTYLRAGQAALAITILEPPVGDRPQRKDLADRLAAAYRGAGREAEAKAVEARFA